jgi:IS5 family transposase
MKNQTLRLVELFVKIDDLSKRKNIVARKKGKGRRGLCVSEVVTIYVWFLKSKVRSFKEFYDGINGQFLGQFFPQMPDYSNFLKHLKKASKSIYKMTQRRNRGKKFFIDSTPLPVCKNVRQATHRTFRGMAQWAHSSVSTTFGLKLHIVVDERQKIVRFVLKPGNLHDVTCAEEVLHGCRGIVIGDKGYCSEPLAKRLISRGLRLIARRKQNMTHNTEEEKRLLKKRSLVETVIGKFKNFFGASLSRFRSPRSAFSAILAVNFPF